MNDKILIKVANSYKEIKDNGYALIALAIEKCQIKSDYKIIEISDVIGDDVELTYWVIVDRDECIDKLVYDHKIESMSLDTFEIIKMDAPWSVVNITLEDEDESTNCMIL